MNQRADHLIAEKLKELPSYKPADGLWNSIEWELTMDEVIEKGISQLPLHKPNYGTWDLIAEHLPGRRRFSPNRKYLYFAAAVSLFLVVGIPLIFSHNDDVVVESEIVYPEEAPFENADDHLAIEAIENLCNSGVPVCDTDDFKEKLALYQELNQELQQIENIVEHVGDSPEIIKTIIRLENLKSDTLQELIQLVYS